ncbi:MAG: acetyl-CoA carboxylase carboxyltransferase subunit alpha [Candidatus Ozemobacteraceae bacterium]|jgi:acetyl-CoA carboxylase carboxyl transferase subunit alpha|nr:acetyl-CoA carboxylase carboxyltransferase subunit alpha [Candidatus Riflebacteria bacterium]NLV92958.1 acetyl-CoA carboxylase carboxyltransferase subunit alpha [Candidatus Riflebacteria bacterium]
MALELDFEKPIIEIEKRIEDLKVISDAGHVDLTEEIALLSSKIEPLKKEIYNNLEPWQVAKLARHIDRPSTLEYVKHICGDDFVEMHGDRLFGDDPAIVGGIGLIDGRSVMIIGHQKGCDTQTNIYRNFGMPHPEGYRKALRLMRFAEQFNMPVVTFIDTPGAFPGIGAEERGQSEAIAKNLAEMSALRVPIICFITGEGGSGGALALGVGDKVFMFEFSIYSVISAEGCAAILWNDPNKAKEAASALKFKSTDLLKAGIIDEILNEPLGGAHRDHKKAAEEIKKTISKYLPTLIAVSADNLIEERYNRFRRIGKFAGEEEQENG